MKSKAIVDYGLKAHEVLGLDAKLEFESISIL